MVRRSPVSLTINSLLQADLPGMLVEDLSALAFETRKDVVQLIKSLLSCVADRQQLRLAVVVHIKTRPRMIHDLLQGCGDHETSLFCSRILRDFAQYEELVQILLEEGNAGLELIALANHADFDVAYEAFATLRELLLCHKDVAARYVGTEYTELFTAYKELLHSPEYVTRRQALKLLGEMLLDMSYNSVMRKYVLNDSFLRVHMNLLVDNSPTVQIAAFHVLKVFAQKSRSRLQES